MSLKWTIFYIFPLALLRYNWYIILCKFKVHTVMSWYMAIWLNVYHKKVANTSFTSHSYHLLLCWEHLRSILLLRKLDKYMQENAIWPSSYITLKNELNMGWNINIRPETIKLLEENTAEELLDTGPGSSFLDLTAKAKARKTKTNWWGYHRLKSFHSKEVTNKMRKQPTGWKKIFANHMSDKGSISKI